MTIPAITVSALRGGSGKTMISIGLIASWREQGFTIFPFKKGPDYIDTGWLALAADRPCYNLDNFLIPPDKIQVSYQTRVSSSGIAVASYPESQFAV